MTSAILIRSSTLETGVLRAKGSRHRQVDSTSGGTCAVRSEFIIWAKGEAPRWSFHCLERPDVAALV